MKARRDRFIVYALIDPRTGLMRYIGRCWEGSKRRSQASLNEHAHGREKVAWFAELRGLGLRPWSVVLESDLELEGAIRMEEHWIQLGRYRCWPLLNGNGRRSTVGRTPFAKPLGATTPLRS